MLIVNWAPLLHVIENRCKNHSSHSLRQPLQGHNSAVSYIIISLQFHAIILVFMWAGHESV